MRASREIRVDDLLRSARASAGIGADIPADGPGEELHAEGLRHLIASIGRHGERDPAKLQILRHYLSLSVAASFQLEKDIAEHPEIKNVPLEAPLFVVGFGRTGSTFIHNLLALDPNARAPRLWELWSPSPPPRPDAEPNGPRLALARLTLGWFAKEAPLVLQIHSMDPEAPDECHHLMRHSTHLPMLYNAPEYWEWLRDLSDGDLAELFSHYRKQVQQLQLHYGDRRWVSKSLAHLHYLPILFDVFPGAKVVRLHRDPCEQIPSHCSLYANLRKMFETSVDPKNVGQMVSDIFIDGIGRMVRADGNDTRENCIDVLFDDLVARPTDVISEIYSKFGFEYRPDFHAAMVQYIERTASEPKFKHKYGLEEFGLSRKALLNRSEEYLEWLKSRTGARIARA